MFLAFFVIKSVKIIIKKQLCLFVFEFGCIVKIAYCLIPFSLTLSLSPVYTLYCYTTVSVLTQLFPLEGSSVSRYCPSSLHSNSKIRSSIDFSTKQNKWPVSFFQFMFAFINASTATFPFSKAPFHHFLGHFSCFARYFEPFNNSFASKNRKRTLTRNKGHIVTLLQRWLSLCWSGSKISKKVLLHVTWSPAQTVWGWGGWRLLGGGLLTDWLGR